MKACLAVALVLAIVGGQVGHVTGHNVLMIIPFPSQSHKNAFDPLAEELVRRGHEVTLMAPLPPKKNQPGVTYVFLEATAKNFEQFEVSFFQMSPTDASAFFAMLPMITSVCESVLGDPAVQDILQNPRDANGEPRFQLMVVDGTFGEFTLSIAHHLDVPAVLLTAGHLLATLAWSLDIPVPLSYVPFGVSATNRPMTFGERAINAFQALVFEILCDWWIMPIQDEVTRTVLPDSPPLAELKRNVSFVLTNTHPALHGAAPKMPYYVEIGGINCRPAKPLPEDLEDFVASSGDEGVIYFSLGSYCKGDSMPEDMKRKILDVFARLPQKVLWKYESSLEGVPPNVRLISWAPQQDLLGHPKMKLFITHGGILSMHEAAYHGCPILGFPLSADQWGNVAHAKHAGFSEFLDWKTFTSEELSNTIRIMVTDPRYKTQALRLSQLYKDDLQPPAERAAYWLEYVVRHRGAPHLKSGAGHLNFFQYFLLDVISAVFLMTTVVLGLVCCLVKKALVVLCRWRCSKTGAKPKALRDKKRN